MRGREQNGGDERRQSVKWSEESRCRAGSRYVVDVIATSCSCGGWWRHRADRPPPLDVSSTCRRDSSIVSEHCPSTRRRRQWPWNVLEISLPRSVIVVKTTVQVVDVQRRSSLWWWRWWWWWWCWRPDVINWAVTSCFTVISDAIVVVVVIVTAAEWRHLVVIIFIVIVVRSSRHWVDVAMSIDRKRRSDVDHVACKTGSSLSTGEWWRSSVDIWVSCTSTRSQVRGQFTSLDDELLLLQQPTAAACACTCRPITTTVTPHLQLSLPPTIYLHSRVGLRPHYVKYFKHVGSMNT